MCTVDTLSSLLELRSNLAHKQNQGERRAKPFPSYTGIWSLRLPSYKRAQGLFHRTRAFGLFCRLGLFFRLRSFHRTQVLLASIVQGPLVSSVDTVRTKCCFLPAPPAHPPPSILYGQAARKASSHSPSTLHLYGQAARKASYGDVHRAAGAAVAVRWRSSATE